MKENSSFRMVFGNSAIVKVIDFFLDNREFDYSLTDIAKNADIGWSTLHMFWNKLVNIGIVEKTRRIGRAELYRLNMKSPLVKKLIELDFAISRNFVHKELENQKVKISVWSKSRKIFRNFKGRIRKLGKFEFRLEAIVF